MAKPPETPPNSDIEGVHRDRKPIDSPEHADPELRERLIEEEEEAKGRPPGGRV